MNAAFTEQLGLLPGYLSSHLRLTLLALGVGIALSVPLGIFAARHARLGRAVLGLANIIQTIPGLALLAVMVPLLAAVGLPSLGFLPAFLALVLYSVLPVLRNTVTGLQGVDPALIEAARGIGMTDNEKLWRVELPLALPVMLAGIRTAAVWTVGMATLSTPVGATSLGNFIFSGLQTRNGAAILVGCTAAAALALTLDLLLGLLARGREQRRPVLVKLGVAGLALLALAALVTSGRELLQEKKPGIVIGAKTFTEQYILSEILAGTIRRETGLEAKVSSSLGSTVAYDALRLRQIDVYVEYSGTVWATLMKREDIPSRAAVLEGVKTFLRENHQIEVIAEPGFENAYALAMRREQAEMLGIRTISDLKLHAPNLNFGGDYEFFARAEWRAIREKYQLKTKEERSMDPSLMYEAIGRGDVDVISAFSTDGRIAAFDLVVLEDNREAMPPYDAIILIRAGLEADFPEAAKALQQLQGSIDDPQMRELNRKVDQEGQSPTAVATEFLQLK